jgi:hypothetical protein
MTSTRIYLAGELLHTGRLGAGGLHPAATMDANQDANVTGGMTCVDIHTCGSFAPGNRERTLPGASTPPSHLLA